MTGKVFVIVDFDWPQQITPEMYAGAGKLHRLVEEADWIDEVMAGFGGSGGSNQSNWIFSVENFASLDSLFAETSEDEIVLGYKAFFGNMKNVRVTLRQAVTWK